MPTGIYNHRQTKTPIYTLERNQKIKEKLKGIKKKPMSEATKRKIGLSTQNRPNGMLGKKHSEQTKEKMRGRSEEKSATWKGDKVGYDALHSWVNKNLGKANHCEECGLDKIPKGMKRYFDWANISKEYKRILTDWKQLCKKCHAIFDKDCGRGKHKK